MANRNAFDRTVKWQKRSVEREKERVRRELEAFKDHPKKRLHHITHRIVALAESPDANDQLLRYIYVISALVHHLRFGGLSAVEVSRLAKIASAILQTQGIKPMTSNLAFTYGELHMALSQIHRKNGEQWQAAWEQQLSIYLSSSEPPGGPAFQALSLGNRALRLGHGPTAIAHFERAEAYDDGNDTVFLRSRLGRVIALRLAGKIDAAATLTREVLSLSRCRGEIRKELEWESICQAAQITRDLEPMMTAIRRGQSHHEVGYLIEASIWVKIPESRQWLSDPPKVRYLASKKGDRPQRFGALYHFALMLDDCYDYEIPLPTRIRRLGDIILQSQELVSVASEVLIRAAIVRWLHRSRADGLARLAEDEYAALTMRLSGGQAFAVL